MEIRDCIEFNIYGNIRKIELCIGDITKLPMDESVDLLLLSAFPDNYMPIKGTLIGALKDNFNISVKNLAKDKAEDLRLKFNCWISKELSLTLPFRRILCFEQSSLNFNREDQSNLVGAMFRAIFTTFTSKDMSIITPILASGNQRSNKKQMLNELVRACSAWIAAEMPLSCMKIVIYRSKSCPNLGSDDIEAISEFSKLKSEINWKPYSNLISIRHDVLFFYVKEDENAVIIFSEILEKLYMKKITIKLKCLANEKKTTDSKDYNILEKFQRKMLESRKVGLFLSPNFLDYPRAIEVYNLALCISQKTHNSLLTPICLQQIDHIPEYMSMTQWIDCKLKKDNNNVVDQLIEGANCFYRILEDTFRDTVTDEAPSKLLESADTSAQQKFMNFNFDIFISYSHKDAFKCNVILKFLELSLPNSRIFHDKHDIKTGFSWQEIIFNSLSGSKIILALLSENYIQSSMCRDEFNVAISQHWSSQFETKFFPIWISDKSVQSVMDDYPTFFHKSFLMNNIFVASFGSESTENFPSDLRMISIFNIFLDKVIQPLLNDLAIDNYFLNDSNLDLEETALKARMDFFYKTWDFKKFLTFIPFDHDLAFDIKNSSVKPKDIAIGFHVDDLHYASFLQASILKRNRDLQIILCPMGHRSDESQSLKDMETVYLIVILLKPYYFTTKSCRDQLNIALSHQRRSVDSRLRFLPIILETLHHKPSYLHLLPSRFKANDEIYTKIGNKINYSKNSSRSSNVSMIYDIKVSKSIAVMLTLASHWISEKMFINKSFLPPKSLVIYSTFDLATTSFDMPKVADSELLNQQIRIIHISEHYFNSATIFLKNNADITRIEYKPDSTIKDETVTMVSSFKNEEKKSQIITKICSTM